MESIFLNVDFFFSTKTKMYSSLKFHFAHINNDVISFQNEYTESFTESRFENGRQNGRVLNKTIVG